MAGFGRIITIITKRKFSGIFHELYPICGLHKMYEKVQFETIIYLSYPHQT